MKKIAIIQYKLSTKGGAESVAMHMINALQDKYDISFITPLTDINIGDINRFYNISINKSIDIRSFTEQKYFDKIEHISGVLPQNETTEKFTLGLDLLRSAFFLRGIKQIQSEFDLLIWATRGPDIGRSYQHMQYYSNDELSSGEGMEVINSTVPALRYVHCPYQIQNIRKYQHNPVIEKGLSKICELIVGETPPNENVQSYLSNSNFTGKMLEVNNVSCKTLYPPVDVKELQAKSTSWEQRENGFVCVGRIAKDKNIHKNIDLIDRLRNHGHKTHLHIVGIQYDSQYSRKILRLADKKSYINFEGEVTKDELVELISTHKFGIHGKEFERFGIVIAEMVAGGMLPFVHNSGGQTEIVNNNNNLMYDDLDNATNKINAILKDPSKQTNIRDQLPFSDKYSVQRFYDEIQTHVDSMIQEHSKSNKFEK